MEIVEIKVGRLDSGLPLPEYMSEGASGMDLYAREDITLFPREIRLVPTGIKVGILVGFELQIRPRSSLSMQGIGMVNSPGTIDADYRGEIKVILINFGQKPFSIKRGDRIAQAVLSSVVHAKLKVVDKLEPTPRGEGGFGYTGR
jgi:dUTP pyrophosphatase